MRRLIVLALIVGAVFVGLTLYREGPERAFGGAFASVFASVFAPVDRTDSKRSLAAMQRVHEKTSERTNRALGDERFRD
jgi:H+/Cl- antiporter ClcA